MPRIQPMRLTRVAKAFDDPEYIFELKHDGFRALAYVDQWRMQAGLAKPESVQVIRVSEEISLQIAFAERISRR